MHMNVRRTGIGPRMSRGPLQLVPCLWVILLATGGGLGESCGSSDPCPAKRPRDSRGCCPRLLGEKCGYVEGEEEPPGKVCDTELGYSCQKEASSDTEGICHGRYNIRASEVEQRKVVLEWDDFKPVEYLNEYILFWTDDTYKSDISQWNTAEIGTAPRYELQHDLRPSTQYFVRIGVWEDISSETYGNLTETLIFKTNPVAYCEYNNITYHVGQVFNHNCEDNCTCLPSGEFECSPLCELPVIPEADVQRCKREKFNESCCSWKVVCTPLLEDCVDPEREEEYIHGEEFETECEVCVCDNGTVSCEYSSQCERPSESCANPEQVRVAGKCCPKWTCGQVLCEDDGETFENGESWLKESTCERCNCEDGHVACHPECATPSVPENCTRPHLTKRPGSCCDEYECSPTDGTCFYESKNHGHGTYFSNADCELCVCAENSTVVCSPKQCPVVNLPSASIFCPNPHIRTDGCCATLWCEDPGEYLVSIIKSLFGTSYSTHSVTLSFTEEAEAESEEEGHEEGAAGSDVFTKRTYELQYCSGEDGTNNETTVWLKRTFDPLPVHSEDEAVISPTHFLQTTGAIRVGKRVYVTVSEMEANTTYYLKVLVINSGFHDSAGEVTAEPPRYAGAIAVRTLAEELEDRCPTTCHSADVIAMPSPSCPRPVLVQSRDKCCPTWKCFPEVGGCHYKNLVLKNGDHVREHCDRTCICLDGNVTCRPICEAPGDPPRDGCRLETLRNHCCRVWMCSPRTHPVLTMSATISVRYAGTCGNKTPNFQAQFKRFVMDVIKFHPDCTSGTALREECDTAEVSLVCPFSAERTRREVAFITVNIYLTANVSSRSLDVVKQSLADIVSVVVDVFNSSSSTITLGGKVYHTEGSALITPPSADCQLGYIYYNYTCIQGVTPSTTPTSLDIPLHVSTSSNSAVLAWRSLMTPRTRYITGLQIEYREETELEDIFTWNQTDPLDPSATSHELTRLHAARGYKARLVVFTNIMASGRVRLTPVRFETKPFARYILNIAIHLKEVSVSKKTVTFKWARMAESVMKDVVVMEMRYSRAGARVREPADMGSEDGVHIHQLDRLATSVTMSGLVQSQAYVAQLVLVFRNTTVAKSGTIHFVTMGTGASPSLLVPLLVSAIVVVCAVIIVIITCCLWRRSSSRSPRETAFENKTFGLHIETDGRSMDVIS